MDRTLSLLLDLLRFVAAFLVFVHHAEQILKDSRLSVLASFGHDAVIFFFILSGFVIGYVSHVKEHNLSQYFVARLARLYSVAIPSLLLAYALVCVGAIYFGGDYVRYANEDWLTVFLNSFFFMNQSWGGGLQVPTNGPYWSVCYEAWYYVIFGVAFYLSGMRRTVLLILVVVLAGPKVMVLMPIWIMGLFFYVVHQRLEIRKSAGYACVGMSIAFYLVLRVGNFDDFLFSYSARMIGGVDYVNVILGFSKRFVPDFIIAVVFIVFLYGIYMVREVFSRQLIRYKRIIKLFASYTFSLYLFHFPLLLFLSKAFSNTWIVLLSCIFITGILGYFTEMRKNDISRLIEKIIAYASLYRKQHS